MNDTERKKAPLPKYTQGIKCPECGCRDLRIYGTKREGGRVRRYRSCRACGYSPIYTLETVVDSDR